MRQPVPEYIEVALPWRGGFHALVLWPVALRLLRMGWIEVEYGGKTWHVTDKARARIERAIGMEHNV